MELVDLTGDDENPVIVIDDDAPPSKKLVKKIGKGTNAMVLKQHQVTVLTGLRDQPGMLAVHRTGSGKTLLGLAVRRQLRLNWKPEMKNVSKGVYAVVVCPLKVKEQYQGEVSRLGLNSNLFKFMTYEALRNEEKLAEAKAFLDHNPFNVLIFDEAHRLNNFGSETAKQALQLSTKAKFVLCTTATPIVNSQADLAPLVTLITNEKDLPLDKKKFNEKFRVDKEGNVAHVKELEDAVQGVVSVYLKVEESDRPHYPEVTYSTKTVKMTAEQFQYYNIAEQKNRDKLKGVLNKEGDVDEDKLKKLNSFLSQTRQLCNTVAPLNSTLTTEQASLKLVEVIKYVKKNPKPAVVFSHFLESGVEPLQHICTQQGMTFRTITGNSKEKPQQAMQAYNNREVDVLFLSAAGAEGLDLKGTRQIHIVDQPWTDTRLKQVIGRGIRYKSHDHLPAEQRKVEVVQWICKKTTSQMKQSSLRGGAVDELWGGGDWADLDMSHVEDYLRGGKRKTKKSPKRPKTKPAKSPTRPPKEKEKGVVPTADELLQKINQRKREVTEAFMQILACSSIERSLGQEVERCTRPAKTLLPHVRGKLTVEEILE